MIDFNLALGLCNVLSKAFPIDIFDKAKGFLNKKKVKAEI
jgi:niacin transporter